ncbi:MAG: MliC family protein [Halofilum sp. (in: g-proteobacteria)]|nr:MliC family protein [Halofilum sp. (in: g-proteobacteria)]
MAAIAVLLPALLSGCAALVPTSTVTTSGGDASADSGRDGPFARVYTCPDGFRFSARAGSEEAHLDLGSRRVSLAREPSDSGTRYTDGETLFQTRGSEATIEVDAAIRSGCRGRDAADPWEAAALRGVDLRALGQEPGWTAEVVEGEWLRVIRAGEDDVLVARDPARERTDAGATVYTGEADGERLRLQVTESACTDSMSGESLPLTATLTLDGRELQGCARRPVASSGG